MHSVNLKRIFLIKQPALSRNWQACQFHQPNMCCKPKCTCISGISTESKVFCLRLFFLLSYMYAGAFVFMAIEREATKMQIEENKIHMEILKNITMSEHNMTEDQFTKLVNELKPLSCSNLPEWSYEHATSFALQLLTTIGRSDRLVYFSG